MEHQQLRSCVATSPKAFRISKKNRTKLPRPSIFDELKNEKKVEEVVEPVVEVVVEDDVELEETKAIPWSPQFDHTDDLGGVLLSVIP